MSCALATVSLCGSVETVQWPGDSDDVSDICLITEPWSHIMSATDIMSNYVTLFTLHCCCLSSDQCDYENIIQVATFPVYQVMTMTVTVTDHHHLDRKLRKEVKKPHSFAWVIRSTVWLSSPSMIVPCGTRGSSPLLCLIFTFNLEVAGFRQKLLGCCLFCTLLLLPFVESEKNPTQSNFLPYSSTLVTMQV